ncbi:transposase [Candidatus Thiodictyon syntrophicum]|uniref:IS91 family transposase n=1 Tax=Candidatus Thiodictyon syntrophicum TaxID=1166950 RepID=A0A2K8UHV1_9GAMM|nr:transposase [Candidatus Thiodictyon syntrophicum]AUB85154.1 IS91 family transposase [Candidatus Thiodictyon syntrophicum]
MAANPPGCRPAVYARRRPEQTVLYRLVQQHLETYLALACDGDGHAVPGYVERELRRYLECGILAYGFCQARCPACGQDFLVAFSCKGRICPSCNARRMAETAAHLVDHVFPPLPVRQWVLSVPKRLRWYLEREPGAVTAVLHIFLRVVETHLRRICPEASARARFGAVSFVHRFGASLNRHIHYHCCILDGVFEPLQAGGVQFRQASSLAPEQVAVIEAQVRRRVLRWFSRRGLLDPDDARDMLTWDNSGFSLDASVCIAGDDRAGLERLLRYCARPPFALERIEQVSEDRIVYRLPEPQRDGRTALSLSPLELIDHLAALIPPPRLHRHRYHGVLAPNAPLRLAATAYGRDADPTSPPPPPKVSAPTTAAPSSRSPAHYLRAMLLARLFASLPLVCPNCGADMRIIAFITEATPVRRILLALDEPAEPPRIAPARGPPAWDDPPVEAVPDWDALAQPSPEYVFNQEVQW